MSESLPELRIHELVEAHARPRRGAPLVLLHGFTGDSTTWSTLLPHLGADRRVVGVDLPGHGDSPTRLSLESYAMQVCAAAVDAALSRAAGGPVHLLGYSMGGRVALTVASRHQSPLASLVLVGATPGLVDPAERRQRVADDEKRARFIEEEGLERFVDRWMAHPLFATQARLGAKHLDLARRQRLRNDPAALASCLRGMGTGAMEPLWDRLAGIGVPTLILVGELDIKFVQIARRMSALLPSAELVVVPDAGHAAHLEAPAIVGPAVQSFLARVDEVV